MCVCEMLSEKVQYLISDVLYRRISVFKTYNSKMYIYYQNGNILREFHNLYVSNIISYSFKTHSNIIGPFTPRSSESLHIIGAIKSRRMKWTGCKGDEKLTQSFSRKT